MVIQFKTKHLVRRHRAHFRLQADMISKINALSWCAISGFTRHWMSMLLSNREPDPIHLENWLAVNEARILGRVAHRPQQSPLWTTYVAELSPFAQRSASSTLPSRH
jgi:hypothetical protein